MPSPTPLACALGSGLFGRYALFPLLIPGFTEHLTLIKLPGCFLPLYVSEKHLLQVISRSPVQKSANRMTSEGLSFSTLTSMSHTQPGGSPTKAYASSSSGSRKSDYADFLSKARPGDYEEPPAGQRHSNRRSYAYSSGLARRGTPARQDPCCRKQTLPRTQRYAVTLC